MNVTRARAIFIAVVLLFVAAMMGGNVVFGARPDKKISPYVNLFGASTAGPCVIESWVLLKEDGIQEEFQIPSRKMLVIYDIGFSVTQLSGLGDSTTVALGIKVPPENPSDSYATSYHYFKRAAVDDNNAAMGLENMTAGFATIRPFSAEVLRVSDYQRVSGTLYVRIKGILVDAR
jgi:hypothetical protein